MELLESSHRSDCWLQKLKAEPIRTLNDFVFFHMLFDGNPFLCQISTATGSGSADHKMASKKTGGWTFQACPDLLFVQRHLPSMARAPALLFNQLLSYFNIGHLLSETSEAHF